MSWVQLNARARGLPESDAPTFETIGRLAVYTDDAFSRLDEMRECIGRVPGRPTALAENPGTVGRDARAAVGGCGLWSCTAADRLRAEPQQPGRA